MWYLHSEDQNPSFPGWKSSLNVDSCVQISHEFLHPPLILKLSSSNITIVYSHPGREAIKSRKPSLTNNRSHFSRNACPRRGKVDESCRKNTVEEYNRELFSRSFVHLHLADGRWYKIEGYIATAYRRSDRSYIPAAGRSLSIQTGAPFGVFWMIQSVRTINNHAYRYGLPAPSETLRNKLIRHRWRMAATHCNTHLTGFSTIDRDENEHVIRAKLQFSNKGWNITKMTKRAGHRQRETLYDFGWRMIGQRSFLLF